MIINQIAAIAKNRVIGNDGQLPWHLPEDLKYFKAKTKDCMVLMGRKTFESIGRPLPNRLNVIVTRQEGYKAEGASVFQDIPSAMKECAKKASQWQNNLFIVGGSEIYRQTLELSHFLYITEIHQNFEGDTHFPEWGPEFLLEEKEDHFEPFPHSYCLYINSKIEQ